MTVCLRPSLGPPNAFISQPTQHTHAVLPPCLMCSADWPWQRGGRLWQHHVWRSPTCCWRGWRWWPAPQHSRRHVWGCCAGQQQQGRRRRQRPEAAGRLQLPCWWLLQPHRLGSRLDPHQNPSCPAVWPHVLAWRHDVALEAGGGRLESLGQWMVWAQQKCVLESADWLDVWFVFRWHFLCSALIA